MDQEVKTSKLAKLSDRIKDLDKKLDELKTRATTTVGTVKADYEKLVDDLRGKKQDAEAHLDKMKTASGASWKEIKKGSKKTIDSINKTIEKALAKLKQ